MAVDLTGGLDPAFEDFVAARPANPAMRDSATLWIMDDSGEIAFPRVTLDAIGAQWERPWVQLNAVLRDGRAFRVWEQLPGLSATEPDGRVATRGAGPLVFRRLEPYRRWALAFDGTARRSTTQRQMAGQEGGEGAPLAFHVEAEMV